jgi:hypothetical protein
MRPLTTSILLAALVAGAPGAVAQAPLTCQSGAGIDPSNCAVVHYHVKMYRPDTKTSMELTGLNQFASRAACEAALAAEKARNAAVVDFLKKNEPRLQYQADQFGPCHCDMTRVPSSANYLDDVKRANEQRAQGDILTRVRLRLLDSNALPNSELVRSLRVVPSSFDAALWPTLVVSPAQKELESTPQPLPESAIKVTSVGADAPTAAPTQAIDFPLVDVPTPKDVMVIRAVAPSVISTDPEAEPSEVSPDTAPAEAPSEANAAEAFVNYETARVQAILKAAGQIDDAGLKKSIFEAAMARLQLLSNLKLVVETAGARSRLAAAFGAADDETARLDLVAKLFGESVRAHWAPTDARDAIIDIPEELTGDPFAVLRESTGKYDGEQQRQALYHLLARTSNLTSSQLLSLSDLMQSFL